MVAAEYEDRWRLASARTADETEVVVGSFMTRRQKRRRRRRRRRPPAGSHARRRRGGGVRGWRRTRRARRRPQVELHGSTPPAHRRRRGGGRFREHLGRRRPKRGAAVRAIVLDADPLSGTLSVSLDDALVAAADGATPKGKRKRGSADGVEALRKGGATVTAVVQTSTPQRLILSLPDHGHASPLRRRRRSGGTSPSVPPPRRAADEVGASVRCVTLKSPAPSEDAGGLAPRAPPPAPPPPPLFVRLEADASFPTAAEVTAAVVGGGGGRAGVAHLRRRAEATVGNALATVTERVVQLDVRLDKKGAVVRASTSRTRRPGHRRRLPTAVVPRRRPRPARARGGGGAASFQLDATGRPRAAGGAAPPAAVGGGAVVGAVLGGWSGGGRRRLRVTFSPTLSGKVEASMPPAHAAADLGAHFAVGQPCARASSPSAATVTAAASASPLSTTTPRRRRSRRRRRRGRRRGQRCRCGWCVRGRALASMCS